MKSAQNPIEIYQLRVVLRETSPHIWRRFLVRSDSSIVDLHQTIQIAFGWSGRRAFAFEVQGHRRDVRLEGDARDMLLADFRFYEKERFTYTYNTAEQEGRPWRFEIRLEQQLAMGFCRVYEEVRNFFRTRSQRNEAVSLAWQRALHVGRMRVLMATFAVA